MPALRVLLLTVGDAPAAREVLRKLVASGGEDWPTITTVAPWAMKPDVCVNIGFTAAGLRALGLAPSTMDSFPEEFLAGAEGRANVVGDTGESAPEHWVGGFGTPDAQALVTIFGVERGAVETATDTLRELFGNDDGWRIRSSHDGEALPPGNVTHFGYQDGFAQPTIEGAPAAGRRDPQPAAPRGEFLLGHPSQHPGWTYPVPQPAELGTSGSFAAFRKLEQDVVGFEAFLHTAAGQAGLDVEAVAAKLCGRWRNGVPLAMSPDRDTLEEPVDPKDMNNFDYVDRGGGRGMDYDDRRGYRCPIGSHIRRVNPCGARVAGAGGHLHRLVRRGLPYGPLYDPTVACHGVERGLLGLFINVSLRDQYEFIMKDWVNGGTFAPGLRGSRCPIAGDDDPVISRFSIPMEEDDTRVVSGFARFTKTRGGAYCFLPSMTGLRFLASR